MNEYYLLTFESTHAAIKPEKREEAEEIFRQGSKLRAEDYAYYHVVRDTVSGDVQCDPIGHIE